MTTQYSTIAKTGRVQAGEAGTVFKPRVINGSGRYPIVACHGAASSWDQWESPSWLRMNKQLVKAAQAGIPSIAEYLGGDTIGAPTGTARIAAALTAVAAETGCSSSKCHLVACSGGSATALNYAIANPTKVASMTLMLPTTSIINGYQKNPPVGSEANAVGNIAQLFATAWGLAYRTVTDAVTNGTTTLTSATAAFTSGDNGKVLISKAANGIPAGTTITYVNPTTVTMSVAASTTGTGRIVGIGAPMPAGANLLANAGALSGIPTLLYYAPDDTLIDPADVTAMAAAIGVSAQAVATNGGGHTNTGLLPTAFDFDAWVAWLITNGA